MLVHVLTKRKDAIDESMPKSFTSVVDVCTGAIDENSIEKFTNISNRTRLPGDFIPEYEIRAMATNNGKIKLINNIWSSDMSQNTTYTCYKMCLRLLISYKRRYIKYHKITSKEQNQIQKLALL